MSTVFGAIKQKINNTFPHLWFPLCFQKKNPRSENKSPVLSKTKKTNVNVLKSKFQGLFFKVQRFSKKIVQHSTILEDFSKKYKICRYYQLHFQF